jgi:pimeloyl-ACP methyl ester carboxylesterase
MRIMTLSGWGQPHDALAETFPDAMHLKYAHLPSMQQALEHIADTGKGYDVVVGWSLGGRLAVQAILAGLMKPDKLVLIASAFQFSRSTELPLGIPREQYEKFRGNYQRNALRTLDKGWELIVKGDKHAEHIRNRFSDTAKQAMLAHDWLRWLDDLNGLTLHGASLAEMPPTLLLHGANDVVVTPDQSRYYTGLLPQAKLVMLEACGHAPHWHDPQLVRDTVEGFIRV